MPSDSLKQWLGERSRALDGIELAHASVAGGAGSRRAAEQIVHAYASLLSSQFQGFCRNLHSECVDHMIRRVAPEIQAAVSNQFRWARMLDRGNPNPGNIGTDFGRLGIAFCTRVYEISPRNVRRRAILDDLNTWRNAIAHHEFNPARLGGVTSLRIATGRRWRRTLDHLARSFDRVMKEFLSTQLSYEPW